MKTSPETAALNDLLNTLNNPNIDGVTPVDQRDELDKHARNLKSKGAAHPGPKIEDTKPEPCVPLPPVRITLPKKAVILSEGPFVGPRKLFFTGRLKAGKDHAAASVGATIFGFADPLYAIATHFFRVTISATQGKDLPGVREFLQSIGQWGRAVVSEKYPLTPLRALFCAQVREQATSCLIGDRFPEVDWITFGNNPDIWLNACVARVDSFLSANPQARVAITNCRFEHEFKRLTAEGYQHWHCMVSPATWTKRLAVSKLTPESPAVKDLSEQLAAALDGNVTKQLSAAKQGAKLRCIWNDDDVQPPSPRLHSLATFLQSIKGA